MAILQVRDFPADTYELLSRTAVKENRSISQQAITIIQNALQGEPAAKTHRRTALEKTASLHISISVSAPAPADLVREERDR